MLSRSEGSEGAPALSRRSAADCGARCGLDGPPGRWKGRAAAEGAYGEVKVFTRMESRVDGVRPSLHVRGAQERHGVQSAKAMRPGG